jgi:putative ABC transport system permease protein
MWRNYFLTLFRVMRRQKLYTTIHVLGLGLGIAASLLIAIFVTDELSYDRFHPGAEHIYRIAVRGSLQGNPINLAGAGSPMAETLRSELPEVTETLRFGMWRTMPVQYGENRSTEDIVLTTDANFFQMFSFRLLTGNPATALQGVNKIVITRDLAVKLFGGEDPMGKIVLMGTENRACEVTGVAENPPHNSHIDFDILLSGDSWDYLKSDYWTNFNCYTFLRLNPMAQPALVEEKMNSYVGKYLGPEIEAAFGYPIETFLNAGNVLDFYLQPLADIHLKSNAENEIKPPGNEDYLYVFSAISLFIILIACINFMNLSTARSSVRAREVGIRKTAGALRRDLIHQFLLESTLYSTLAALFALLLIQAALPFFNQLSGVQLSFSVLNIPLFWAALLAFTLLIGVISGSYPAFYLSRFEPHAVLKGRQSAGLKRSGFRGALVTFQFLISIALIISSLVMYRQIRFMQTKNLGFDKANVIRLLHTNNLGERAIPFRNEVLSHSDFLNFSYAGIMPPYLSNRILFRVPGQPDQVFHLYETDARMLETMGYRMKQGRFFREGARADSMVCVINESAMRQLEWTDFNGKQLDVPLDNNVVLQLEVIGVVEDFHFESLREPVKPLVILPGRVPNFEVAVRLSPGDIPQKLATLHGIWKKYAPEYPFEYSFTDQNYEALFRSEMRTGNIILLFTLLAVFIASIGLFGLATYSVEQRSKEISIRKAMGASVRQLVALLTSNFTRLVLFAFLLAAPVTWYFMDRWLQGFAYRTHLGVAVFAMAGIIALLIAWLTVSFQSLRCAASSPVKYLRNE